MFARSGRNPQQEVPVVRRRKVDAASLPAVAHDSLSGSQFNSLGVSICGPSKAAKLLDVKTHGADNWLESARVCAIAGSCPRSHAEIRSAIRAYMALACKVEKVALPPTVDILLAWSTLFRSSGTFKNYLCGLRAACQIAGVSTAEMQSPLLQKASLAIDKRRGYIARDPMFIRFPIIQRIVRHAVNGNNSGAVHLAMAYLCGYVFLLRMPSECLPIRVTSGLAVDSEQQAVITVEDDVISLRLKRRKNREGGSLLKRRCWCKTCRLTCPVHALGRYFLNCGPGAAPFACFTAPSILKALRSWLGCLGVERASQYRTHDIRRCHARDLQASGATLKEILEAGDWRSASFLKYLDRVVLECDATLAAHLGDCSGEEGDDD